MLLKNKATREKIVKTYIITTIKYKGAYAIW